MHANEAYDVTGDQKRCSRARSWVRRPFRPNMRIMALVWQQPLPPIYTQLSDPELRLRIGSAKEALGDKLVILGHHYQQDAVIEFADFTGDSFELSRKAAEQKNIDYVVFCGVHFMAE